MSNGGGQPDGLDFSVDKDNLYREEAITDLRVANIQKLVPVNLDGSDDSDRQTVFFARTQLNTPQGPIPIQAKLEANTLDEAIDLFPKAMELETQKVVASLKQMQEQQKKTEQSRIIVPGMNN